MNKQFLREPALDTQKVDSSTDFTVLRESLSDELRVLEMSLRDYSRVFLLIVTGIPGVGKTTLVRMLNNLNLPKKLRTFHIDDHIDWNKVVEYVSGNPDLGDPDYLRIANKAALSRLFESIDMEAVLVIEGAGLLSDYEDLAKQAGYNSFSFVVLDANEKTLTDRLLHRGDNFNLTSKERKEHMENLSNLDKYSSLKIDTTHMEKAAAVEELRQFLSYLNQQIQR